MCTFNIALDDRLVETIRPSFPDERSMTAWMEKQISDCVRLFSEKKLMEDKAATATAIDKFFGGWSVDSRSTEEIKSDIRDTRTQNTIFA